MKLGIVLRADRIIRDEAFRQRRIVTANGPVDRVFSGKLSGVETHFLYGRFPGLRTPSWDIPYETNQLVFDELGVDHVIGTFVVGGVDSRVSSGDLVIPHDLVCFAGPQRAMTAPNARFSNAHVIPSLCPSLRALLVRGARVTGIPVHEEGVYFGFYGFGRIETLAELELMQRLGATVVGQTMDPEFTLARQRSLHYASIAVAIDSYDEMRDESAKDPDEFRARSREAIGIGREKFEAILEAGLATRTSEQPDDCGCASRPRAKYRDMFTSYPEDM
jgi:5'-methylthioadenosine phosphorylase